MARVLCFLLAAGTAHGTRPNNAADRASAQLCLQAAAGLFAASSRPLFWNQLYEGSDDEADGADEEMMDILALAAGEVHIRRQIFVPGELRFTIARLESLFGMVHSFSDMVMNVVSNFRFRLSDLPRLRRGACQSPVPISRIVSRIISLRPSGVRAGLRIPDVFHTTGRYRFSGDEGLLVMLYKLHWPCRVSDVAEAGGRGMSAASQCFKVRPCHALHAATV